MYSVFPFGKIKKNSKIVLFGAGKAGLNYFKQIAQNDYCQVMFFVDSDFNKFVAEGRDVKNPECLKNTEFDYLVISILNGKMRSEVKDLLINWGIPEEKIIDSLGSDIEWDQPVNKESHFSKESTEKADRNEIKANFIIDQSMRRKTAVALHDFLTEEDRSVLDLKAGNMHLKNLLPDSVQYIPVDIEKTCEDTIVCNLNNDQFPDVCANSAVISGLLEDIDNPEKLIASCCQRVNKVLVAYQNKDTVNKKGAICAPADIINMFNRCGFILTDQNTEMENIWTLLACFEKAVPNKLNKNDLCTGCGACKNSCGQKAISMQPDEDGYLKPHIDELKCIDCRRCVDVCPAIGYHSTNKKNPSAYALMAADSIRKNCSSGGAFVLMAEKILEQGGTVFGAAWTDDFKVHHVGIHTIGDLNKLMYSKYVQSDTESTYSEVKDLLVQGKKVLYVGCPCQIAGLNNHLKRKYVSLITVDLVCFCHGGSASTFKKYLSENFDTASIADINFRNKDVTGWSRYGYKITGKNGEVFYPDNKTDTFQVAFHGVLVRDKACENCRYANFPRVGDITIGDAWGIDKHRMEWNDWLGTSLMLANNQKGQSFIEAIMPMAKRAEQIPIDYILNKGNRIGPGWRKGHVAAEYLKSLINQGKSFNDAVKWASTGRHDIGLVCFLCRNYGNNLTNYALYFVMQQMGYRVLVINTPTEYGGLPVEDKLSLYAKRRIPLYDYADGCRNKSDLIALNDKVSMFVLGSDQTLRGSFVEKMKYHTCLDWAEADKGMISYASSFGVDEYDASQTVRDAQKLLLKRFDKISVREESGVTILEKDFGLSAQRVMDPVFLMDTDKYKELALQGRVRLNKKKFIGTYILDDTKERREMLSRVAKYRNVDEIHIISDAIKEDEPLKTTGGEIILHNASVEEWIANIYYADFVVTDSFHGICFCLIFNKPFIVVYNSWQWRGKTRIDSILKLVKMEDRLFDSLDDKRIKEATATKIRYSEINNILSKEINMSREWLRASLDLLSKHSKHKDGFDDIRHIYFEENQKLKKD